VAPAIALEDVHKRYRIYRERYRSLKQLAIHRRLGVWEDRWALKGVSLEVPRGSTLGLIGPNGAGKSTTLKVMARILTPDKGRVHTNGRLSALIELGAGFQLEYTGRENIYLNASLLGLTRSEINRKFDAIVAFAELEDHIDAPLRTYSSGMYMRLGFSVAIHVEPEILLVDEILAVGDEGFQRKCIDWLETFQRRGGTIVMVSHSMATIRQMCTQAAWIQNGDLVELGSPAAVIGAYLQEVREQRLDVELERRVHEREQPEVELGEVRLLDERGRPATVLDRGKPLVVEIPYRCNRRVEKPVFGVAMHRNDGAYVYGTNTDVDGISLDPIEADGSLRFRYRSLPVLGGTYVLTVALFGSMDPPTPIDYHEQRYSFQVRPPTEEQGVVHLEHDWELMSIAEPKESYG
jgi:ABC-type polysaccharide/polyol phosphate transport system ATPase subunit